MTQPYYTVPQFLWCHSDYGYNSVIPPSRIHLPGNPLFALTRENTKVLYLATPTVQRMADLTDGVLCRDAMLAPTFSEKELIELETLHDEEIDSPLSTKGFS